MLRLGVATAVVALTVCLPLAGGSSGSRVDGRLHDGLAARSMNASASPALAEADGTNPEPATFRPRFPRFLKDLDRPLSAPRTKPALEPARELLLTFDDGPDLASTPIVLDELDRRGLKAIFFVTGRQLVGQRPSTLARRDLVRKIASHGHLVANHSLTHANLCRVSPEALAQEVDGNAEILAAATGTRPALFRSPYGAMCRALVGALADRDVLQVGWNIDPQDWHAESTEAIVAYVTKKLAELPGRGILLLHDTHPAAVRALPHILDWIEAENRRAATGATRPLRIVDYTVFLPERPLPRTGAEPVLAAIGDSLGELPGLGLVARRLGLR